ncbi:hypothetical protein ARMGADRAFT_1084945 [Armillaria gallica]|uniref:Uncharacterized protein n=1 Tax=Armillaria gallica TaxID=47427 RepID=A0A2H3DAS3_ARMGA|nr:hypothetical protein ARMGADRAFT_1084945 [Armillaria gallica]
MVPVRKASRLAKGYLKADSVNGYGIGNVWSLACSTLKSTRKHRKDITDAHTFANILAGPEISPRPGRWVLWSDSRQNAHKAATAPLESSSHPFANSSQAFLSRLYGGKVIERRQFIPRPFRRLVAGISLLRRSQEFHATSPHKHLANGYVLDDGDDACPYSPVPTVFVSPVPDEPIRPDPSALP